MFLFLPLIPLFSLLSHPTTSTAAPTQEYRHSDSSNPQTTSGSAITEVHHRLQNFGSDCEFTVHSNKRKAGALSPQYNYNLCPILLGTSLPTAAPALRLQLRPTSQSHDASWAGVGKDSDAYQEMPFEQESQQSLGRKGDCEDSRCNLSHKQQDSFDIHDDHDRPADSLSNKEVMITSKQQAEVVLTLDLSQKRPKPPKLMLHLPIGDSSSPKVSIQLECVRVDPTTPIFVGFTESTNTMLYRWNTNHACPVMEMIVVPHSDVQSSNADDNTVLRAREVEENQGDGDDSNDKGDNLMDIPPSRDLRRSIAVTSVLTIASIVLMLYLYLSPPPQLHSFIITHVRPTTQRALQKLLQPLHHIPNFRVGESSLVRWAQEDMGVLDDAEEDQMVNGEMSPFDDQDFDEGIPLKPSPWKKSQRYGHMNYGSLGVGGTSGGGGW